MEEMIALHPTYPESRGDPKKFLDEVRQKFAQIAQQSPEMGEQGLWRREPRYRASHFEPKPAAGDAGAASLPPPLSEPGS